MEHLKHYFETYKESNEVFETSNGFLFHKLSDAEAHAKTLDDTAVKTYSRNEIENPAKTDDELAEEKAAYEAQIEAQKAELQKVADDEAASVAAEKAAADAAIKAAKKDKTQTPETN